MASAASALELGWYALQAALGIPALILVLRRRGTPADPVPRGTTPGDRAGLLQAIGLFAAATLLLYAGFALSGGGTPSKARILVLDGTAKVAAVILAAFLLRPASPGPAADPAPPRRAAQAGILCGLAFLPVATVVVALQQWLRALAGGEMKAQALVTDALRGPWSTFALVAVFAVTVAPLFEETLFRGHLYGGLRSFLGPGASAFLTAAAFALFHGEPDAFPVTFVLGLCLADLRERTGGRSAPIAMHACYNAWQVGGMLLLRLSGTSGGG